jgi:hypothetical protein
MLREKVKLIIMRTLDVTNGWYIAPLLTAAAGARNVDKIHTWQQGSKEVKFVYKYTSLSSAATCSTVPPET